MALTKPPLSMLDADVAAEIAKKLTGDLVQSVHTQSAALATGTTILPSDDTIPQITEGDEYLTATITPTSALNVLEIEVVFFGAISAAPGALTVALFQDATANALACGHQTVDTANYRREIAFRYRMTAGTTAATTFRVRAGANAAATTTMNGSGGARLYGGTQFSSITVRELKA